MKCMLSHGYMMFVFETNNDRTFIILEYDDYYKIEYDQIYLTCLNKNKDDLV